MNDEEISPPLDVWVLVFGLVALVAGFVGFHFFHSDTEPDHPIGIFVVGLIGSLVGLLVGSIFRGLKISNQRRLLGLLVSGVALAIGTLCFYFL